MKINLLSLYQGRATGEQPIQPGVYVDGDHKLLGVSAAYLVATGHAVIIEEPKPAKAEKAAEDKDAKG